VEHTHTHHETAQTLATHTMRERNAGNASRADATDRSLSDAPMPIRRRRSRTTAESLLVGMMTDPGKLKLLSLQHELVKLQTEHARSSSPSVPLPSTSSLESFLQQQFSQLEARLLSAIDRRIDSRIDALLSVPQNNNRQTTPPALQTAHVDTVDPQTPPQRQVSVEAPQTSPSRRSTRTRSVVAHTN
jgi:hypothetical protein